MQLLKNIFISRFFDDMNYRIFKKNTFDTKINYKKL